MTSRKDLHFYTELVVVTVLSLVAAKAWFHWFIRALNKYAGTSLLVDFIAALILTGVAIFGLHFLFSRKIAGSDLTVPFGSLYKKVEEPDPYSFRPPKRYLKPTS